MLVGRRERIMTLPSWSILPRQQRVQATAAELSLVRLGRIVIFLSLPVAFADTAVFGYPLFSLLMNVLYVGYVAVWWPAIGTRRVEAVSLALIGLGLAAVYAGVPLWEGVQVAHEQSAGLPQ